MPSLKQIQANFKKALDAAITSGDYPMTEQGFNQDTFAALNKVAGAYPDAGADEIISAQTAFKKESAPNYMSDLIAQASTVYADG